MVMVVALPGVAARHSVHPTSGILRILERPFLASGLYRIYDEYGGPSMPKTKLTTVDEFIEAAPREAQAKLREIAYNAMAGYQCMLYALRKRRSLSKAFFYVSLAGPSDKH